MKPLVIIPTYWSSKPDASLDEVSALVLDQYAYDHTTHLDDPQPALARCLDSLGQVHGIEQIAVLLVCSAEDEARATSTVQQILDDHPSLKTILISPQKAHAMRQVFERVTEVSVGGDPVSLRGYGAIRNVGLATGAILGCDVVVFLDDDEVVLDEMFLMQAIYGLGQKTRAGLPVLVKSGYFITKTNDSYAPRRNQKWYNRYWDKHTAFNQWMKHALSTSRISRSNILTGGCCAIHAHAFMQVAFDPWITRGEDFDYLLNLRFYGIDTWFDNQWKVKHLPPQAPMSAPRFYHDMFRWGYEASKIEYMNSQIDLKRVPIDSLMPYPGPWLSPRVVSDARKTALLRAIGIPRERSLYFQIFLEGPQALNSYVTMKSHNYLALQSQWRRFMEHIWEHKDLAHVLIPPRA